jgi:acyl-coenzyme A thioesterase PaaI-like protein
MDPAEIIEASPFVEYLGIEVEHAEAGYGEATLELEDCHAGPPDGSIAHGGVISAFADTVAGAATIEITDENERDIATARGVFKIDNPEAKSRWNEGWRETEQSDGE